MKSNQSNKSNKKKLGMKGTFSLGTVKGMTLDGNRILEIKNPFTSPKK